ncbi:SDR family oxidoreductase [Patescibacteria group bacterium]|nr:SDR family oxidoreductase [Patescibacteria group bacterium]
MKKYTNRINGHALVLGGSGGIGSEIVRALVANGVTAVSFTYNRNKAEADALAKDLEALGVKTYYAQLDLRDEKAVKQFLAAAVAAIGEEIIHAVNTVGVSPNVPLQEQTVELWRELYDINVVGSFIATRAIANRMQEHAVKGSIVVITSTNGINSQASYSAPYDASKSAQWHKVLILAEEYAPDIRINGVAPGWVETKMNQTLPPGEREKETEKIWARRWADPAEIASVVLFLLGPASSYIYGQNIMVDGGYR